MGRAPCCDKANVKKGPWSPEEDATLKEFIERNGTGGNWIALPQKAGLKRCGKSCRLRWLNYLRPNIKHGEFSGEEDRIICSMYASIGSRWSIIASQLPGRTDNDIKNYWNTKLKKKLMAMAPPLLSNNQRKPTSCFQASLQNPSSLDSNNNLLYKDCGSYFFSNTTTATTSSSPSKSFTGGLDYSHLLSDTFSVNYYSHLQAQDNLALNPMMHQNTKENFLVFGGEAATAAAAAASCSSSDGSCSHISYGGRKEIIKQGDSSFNFNFNFNFQVQNHISSNTVFEENHKFLLDDYVQNNNGGFCFGDGTHLHQYGDDHIDEEGVKQLISSCSNGGNNNSSSSISSRSFFQLNDDGNKISHQQQQQYYYC